MSKTIYLTEKQLSNLYKSIPQVKKVNSGIMDALAGNEGIAAESCDYEIGFEGDSPLNYAHVIGSAEPLAEEVNPEDVDLSSFEIKDTLNPKIWKNKKLDSRIRLRLLDIADKFIDWLDIEVDPTDIILTGSLASYNWDEKYSDIDLHILVDFSDFSTDEKLLKDYFDSKKKIWNEEHSGINILGFPVELYVQDTKEIHTASGIYSIERNRWLVKPLRKDLGSIDTNEDLIKDTVAEYMNIIDELSEDFDHYQDKVEIRDIYKEASQCMKRLKAERKIGLNSKNKEYSVGNIVFKTLRRNGYIEKIQSLKRQCFNLHYSLP